MDSFEEEDVNLIVFSGLIRQIYVQDAANRKREFSSGC